MKGDDVDVGRLCQAMQNARLVLRRPRQERFDMVRQFVGAHWSDEGAQKSIPCNLLATYVNIVGRKLIANNPRVLLSSWNRAAKPIINAMESWINQQIPNIRLANTLQRVVLDALFSVGVCKVSIATPSDAASASWRVSAGDPIASRVDLDDLVFDVHSRDLAECGFIGHRFRAPLQTIRDSKIYSKARKDLTASEDKIFNLEGDERIGFLGRTLLGGDQEEYEDFVDLWEVYLPRHRLILTLSEEQMLGGKTDKNYGKALRIQNWLGPECGPYHFLGFGHVPGNAMPKAPIQDLYDLHLSINNILRKLIRQAKDCKEVTLVKGGATETGDRVINANDGEAIRADDPEAVKQVLMTQPNQSLVQIFMMFKEVFSWLAGNLDIMGGLSPQSKTAHQDAMLNTNSSATISEMQDRTVTFTTDVVQSLCWFYHHHPQKVLSSEYKLPGMPEISTERHVKPEQRQKIPWDLLNIKIDAYSLQHMTPQSRLQGINQLIGTIMPLMPLAEKQGITLDLDAYLQKAAKYMDEPDIGEILTLREPPPVDAETSSPGAGSSIPPNTNRTYTRQSLAGESAQAKNAAILTMGQGGSQKGAETQGIAQPVGA